MSMSGSQRHNRRTENAKRAANMSGGQKVLEVKSSRKQIGQKNALDKSREIKVFQDDAKEQALKR